jgi:tRNA(Ile)-lysidine synthase
MKTRATGRKRSSSPSLTSFARQLLAEWKELGLPLADETLVIAVSGGADSTALFLGFDELTKKEKLRLNLIVAHLDHGLREASKKDARWVSQFAKELGYDTMTGRAKLEKTPKRATNNLEQAARKARYEFLLRTAKKKHSTLVLTAHTLDDQAETVMMRLLRGSAAEGLSGTQPIRQLAPGSTVKLVRPLLSWARRSDTESYCAGRQIDFRVDEMNEDESFSRVRVRKQLLPLMKSFNNRIVETLSRTATLLSEDATALTDEARRLLELATPNSQATSGNNSETKLPSLNVDVLLKAPAAVRRRALREWILRTRGDLKRLEMVHLLAVEKLLSGERGGRVAELPAGMKVTRKRGLLELSAKKRVEKGPGDA